MIANRQFLFLNASMQHFSSRIFSKVVFFTNKTYRMFHVEDKEKGAEEIPWKARVQK